MRVIAGKYRSRILHSLPGTDIRPTADRLRETLFNVLSAGTPEALMESTWFDLYAGTGAVGIEAISRGAATVHFVESSRAAADCITSNLNTLDIVRGFQVLRVDVGRAIRQLEAAAKVADFVFLDPPYSMEDEYAKTLATLASSHLLHDRSLVIAEHRKKFDPGDAFGNLQRYRKLVQGDAALSFYRRSAETS